MAKAKATAAKAAKMTTAAKAKSTPIPRYWCASCGRFSKLPCGLHQHVSVPAESYETSHRLAERDADLAIDRKEIHRRAREERRASLGLIGRYIHLLDISPDGIQGDLEVFVVRIGVSGHSDCGELQAALERAMREEISDRPLWHAAELFADPDWEG